MTICGFWFLKTGKPLSKKGNAQKIRAPYRGRSYMYAETFMQSVF